MPEERIGTTKSLLCKLDIHEPSNAIASDFNSDSAETDCPAESSAVFTQRKRPINLADVSDLNTGNVINAALASLRGLFQETKDANSSEESQKFEEIMKSAVSDAVWKYYWPKRPRKGFLDLPAEIRLQIYEYLEILDPDRTPLAEEDICTHQKFNERGILPYLGFYLSCRLVKKEIDHEIRKSVQQAFNVYIQNLEKDVNIKGLTLEIPIERPLDPILKVSSSFFEDHSDKCEYTSRIPAKEIGYSQKRPNRKTYVYKPAIGWGSLLNFLDTGISTITIAPVEDTSTLAPRVVDRWCRLATNYLADIKLFPQYWTDKVRFPDEFCKDLKYLVGRYKW